MVSKKLTNDTVKAILAAEGSQRAIAEQFDVSQATVSRIKRGLIEPNSEEIMVEEQRPLEGGIIEPSAPEAVPAAGEQRVEGTSEAPVHLGDGRVLGFGETALVTVDVAQLLIGKGQARAV